MRRLLLGALAAAIFAGCGGGSDSEEDGRKPSSGPYVRRVDSLCQRANPELARITTTLRQTRDAARSGRAGLPETFRRFAVLLRRAESVSESLESGLRRVDPPARERSFHDDLVAAVEKGSANLRQQVRAADARDAVKLRELSVSGSVLNAEAKGLVAGHGGFRFCGRG